MERFKVSISNRKEKLISEVYAEKSKNNDLYFLIATEKNQFVWVSSSDCLLVRAEKAKK